jgi:hypothetical protein
MMIVKPGGREIAVLMSHINEIRDHRPHSHSFVVIWSDPVACGMISSLVVEVHSVIVLSYPKPYALGSKVHIPVRP